MKFNIWLCLSFLGLTYIYVFEATTNQRLILTPAFWLFTTMVYKVVIEGRKK